MERGINRGSKNGRDCTGHPQLIEFHVQAPTDFKGMAWSHLTGWMQVGEELVNEKSCGRRGRRAQQGRAGASRGLISAPRGIQERKENTHGMERSDAASTGAGTSDICSQRAAEDIKLGCFLLEGFSEGWSWVTVTFSFCRSAPAVAVTFVIPLEPLPFSQDWLKLAKSFWGNGGQTGWFVKHAWWLSEFCVIRQWG